MTKRRCAVFTLQRDEAFHLPLWIGYYSQFFEAQDMYVLDHDSTDHETIDALVGFELGGGNVRLQHHEHTFDHGWLLSTVHHFQRKLLKSYEYVLFVDCDEWVIPAQGTLAEFIAGATEPAYRCTGYEVIEENQHRWPLYDKTLLARVPLTWINGYHFAQPEVPVRDDLCLYHLHRLEYVAAWDKLVRWKKTKVDPVALAGGLSWQNFGLPDEDAFKRWFYNEESREVIPMGEPEYWDARLEAELEKVWR